ncbi:MAG: hypothetical protein K940chlam3_01528 [Chlamydiae bacterium]|nr:hypothetical protein [Chlamydiota bacterium]
MMYHFRLLILIFLLTFSSSYAGNDNNLYDRNKREAKCDDGGCYPRRPPYYMPGGYAVDSEDEEDLEEAVDSEEIAEDW